MYPYMQLGSPCRSFSQARRRRVRHRDEPWGVSGLAPSEQAFLDHENAITRRGLRLAELVLRSGGWVAFEHPAKANDPTSRFYDLRAKYLASYFDLPEVLALRDEFGMQEAELAQCALLAAARKPTRFLYSPQLRVVYAPLDALDCMHGTLGHPGGQAFGRDRRGRSLSALSAAYPFALCTVVVDGAALRAGRSVASLRAPTRSLADPVVDQRCVECSAADTPSDESEDDGTPPARDASSAVPHAPSPRDPFTPAQTHDAIHAARYQPPPFASPRHAIPATPDELLRATLRDDTAATRHIRSHHARHAARAPGQPFGRPPPSRAALPPGRIELPSLFLPGIWARVLAWLEAADRAMQQLERGHFAGPGTLVILQDDLQPWARGILWDTSDPTNCVFARPSCREELRATQHRTRQIDGDVLRRLAAELDWDDLDVCDQVSDGVEARTTCSLTTVLAFHHTGMARDLAAARTVIEADITEGWVRPATRHLPRLPLRCLPRNVIITDKTKVGDDGSSLVHYKKARISTDESESSSEDSPNAGIPRFESALNLCTAKDFGQGIAIIATAFGGLHAVGAAVVDLESAFRFLVLQYLDHWLHAFLWWDAEGVVGFCIDLRVAFGGAFGPNRFQRVTLILRAYVLLKMREFDAAQPPPPAVTAWVARRGGLQQRGELPPGADQTQPHHGLVYLDDLALSGGVDEVRVPPYLHRIHIRPDDAAPIDPVTGGAHIPRRTRIHVYALISLWVISLLALAASAPKTQCCTRVIHLGLRIAIDLGVVDCPQTKADVMRLTARDIAAEVRRTHMVDVDTLERLVGRYGNISQIYASLRLWIAAGYALVRMRYQRPAHGRRQPRVRHVRLRPGGRRERELLRLFEIAEAVLHANEGAPLAAAQTFPAATDSGVCLAVSDASGTDGVGGYATLADAPHIVYLLSEWWPADVRTALHLAASPSATVDDSRLAMPAAELFGMYALAAALRRRASFQAIIAVGDCLPAARALIASTSGSAQMRHLLRHMLEPTVSWLAVHVPRELNTTPDRLSHPFLYHEVAAEVPAHQRVERLRLDDADWDVLRAALALPLAVDEMHPAFA